MVGMGKYWTGVVGSRYKVNVAVGADDKIKHQ